MKPKVFVDTNIIVDFLLRREPFDVPAAQLFNLADQGKIEACVPANVFPFLFYLLAKTISSKKAAWSAVMKFRQLVRPLPLMAKTVDLAFASDFKDLEDAMQCQVALQNGLTIFLTRNLKDFKNAPLVVMSAEDFLKTI